MALIAVAAVLVVAGVGVLTAVTVRLLRDVSDAGARQREGSQQLVALVGELRRDVGSLRQDIARLLAAVMTNKENGR